MIIEDNLYKYLNIYRQSPKIIKKILAYFYNKLPLNIRYGPKYKFFSELVSSSEKWSIEKVENWQLSQLNKILYICKNYIPFYKDKLTEIRLPINSLDEFKYKVPFTTKEEVRNNTEAFINTNYSKSSLIKRSTGGTTGEPLILLMEKGINRTKEFVYMTHQWERVNYEYGDLVMIFRSSQINNRKTNNRFRFDYIKNRLYVSSYHLSLNDIKLYVYLLNHYKPKFLHVYPSVLTLVCHTIISSDLKIEHNPIAILSGSENTFPHQIELFKYVFNCEVFRWYGLGEQASLAGSCEKSTSYHPFPTYSFTELVGKDDKHVNNVGEKGQIVGTPFFNYAFPLLRYKTQDYGYFEGNKCNLCGRPGPIISEIEGRSQEIIINFEGERKSLGPYIFGIHREFWGDFAAIQFYQTEPGKLILRSKSYKLSRNQQLTTLKKTFLERFKDFKLVIQPNAKIKKSKIGKHKYLIQKLDTNKYIKE